MGRPTFPVQVKIEDAVLTANPKVFKSGRAGWHLSCKTEIEGMRVQVSLCLIVIGDAVPTVQPAWDDDDVVTLYDESGNETPVGPLQATEPAQATQEPPKASKARTSEARRGKGHTSARRAKPDGAKPSQA